LFTRTLTTVASHFPLAHLQNPAKLWRAMKKVFVNVTHFFEPKENLYSIFFQQVSGITAVDCTRTVALPAITRNAVSEEWKRIAK
jgi:hypothetical protein